MAIKRIDESPSISDQIIFDILTTDTNGCPADPYKITNITISFLARDFSSNSSEQSFTLNLSDTINCCPAGCGSIQIRGWPSRQAGRGGIFILIFAGI